MAFASARQENSRWLLLAGGAAILEIFVLSGTMFSLLKTSAQWPPPLQLLTLMVPRFVVMALLTTALGPFRKRVWVAAFLVLYAALLLVRFSQAEAFVNWDSTIAASRATLPYLAGFAGAVFGIWLRRKAATSGAAGAERLSSSD